MAYSERARARTNPCTVTAASIAPVSQRRRAMRLLVIAATTTALLATSAQATNLTSSVGTPTPSYDLVTSATGTTIDQNALNSQLNSIANDGSLSQDQKVAAINAAVNNATSSTAAASCADQLDPVVSGLSLTSDSLGIVGDIGEAAGAAELISDFEIPGIVIQTLGDSFGLASDITQTVQSNLPICDKEFTGTISADANIAASQGISADNGAIFLGNTDGISYQPGITLGGGALSGAGAGGLEATTGDVNAIAVGNNAFAALSGSIALGLNASSTAADAVAIGTSSTASALDSAAIGNVATASGVSASAFGDHSSAAGQGSVAVGSHASASDFVDIAIGDDAQASSNQSAAIGAGSKASGLGSSAFGAQSDASGAFSIAAGDGSNASGASSVAMGNNANATKAGGIAVGLNASSTGVNAIAIGTGAVATGSVGIGAGAVASNGGAAYGDNAQAIAPSFGTAVGPNSSAVGDESVAGGYRASATGRGAVAVGANSSASGILSSAFGEASAASGDNSLALGARAVAVGSNSVALGAGSVANEDNTVSVGAPGDPRRITNVKRGYEMLDAVNYSQFSAAILATAAAPSITTPSAPGKSTLSFNTAYFRGQEGFGFGFAHSLNTWQPAIVDVTAAEGSSKEWVFRAGLSVEF